MKQTLLYGLVLLTALASRIATADDFYLKDGERILFLGDSITYAGDYVTYVDAFLFTRFPEKQFTVINRGIPSETVAGTSEPSHVPPRPDMHTRFSTTAPPLRPDVIFVSYGMNDGIYRSFNEPVFAKYRSGIKRVIDRVEKETGARLVLLTPAPFDATPHKKKQPAAGSPNDYRFPALDYDQTLAQYSRWLRSLRSDKLPVIDLHTPINAHLTRRRESEPEYGFAGDGIHPNSTGHWLMAQYLLLGLNAPAVVAEDWVDLAEKQTSAAIQELSQDASGVRFVWKSKLPMPISPRWDAKAIEQEQVNAKLNHYTLRITSLPAGEYRLLANGVAVGTFNHEQLAAAIDLMQVADFPTHKRSQEVLSLVERRQQLLKELWIKDEPHPRMADTRANLLKNSQATPEQAEALEQQIRELCQPQPIEIRLERVAQ